MKHEWGNLLVAAFIGVAVLTGCAAPPKTAPTTPTPPTTAQAGATTIVAVAPPAAPCCPKQTLPGFLGINGLAKGLIGGIDRLRNRLGSRFPGLEARPPVLAITDPANTGPNAPPAVKAAAEIKAEEDAAPQKIKALRYLATVGCAGCYPGVEEGLLAALDDCTEAVRYEAVKAIRDTIGNPCKTCRSTACCSPKLRKRLDQIAHETDDKGCFKESSARIRRLARVALCDCGGPTAEPAQTPVPAEGPAKEPTEAKPPAATAANQDAKPMTAAEAIALLTSSKTQTTPELPASRIVVAKVNGEPIYFNEIATSAERRLANAASFIEPSQIPAARLAAQRDELERTIRRKLICQDARRGMPPTDVANAHYQTSAEDPASPGTNTLAPHEEERLAEQWTAQILLPSETVSESELRDFYTAHVERYQKWRQLRWEQVTARPELFPTPAAAAAGLTKISGLSDQPTGELDSNLNLDVFELQTVDANQCTELPSDAILNAVTQLPLGALSPVLEDSKGLHLVCVLERAHPSFRPFEEVADAVRHDLEEYRRTQAREEYLRDLRSRAEIWTDLDAAAERSPATAVPPAPMPATPTTNASPVLTPSAVLTPVACPCEQ